MALERGQGYTDACDWGVGLTFVGELVEATEGVDLLIPHIGHGGIDETGGLRANGGNELWLIALSGTPAVPRGTRRHDKGLVGGVGSGRRRGNELAFRRSRSSLVAGE